MRLVTAHTRSRLEHGRHTKVRELENKVPALPKTHTHTQIQTAGRERTLRTQDNNENALAHARARLLYYEDILQRDISVGHALVLEVADGKTSAGQRSVVGSHKRRVPRNE